MISTRDIEKKFSCGHGTAVKIMRYAIEVEGPPTEEYWLDLAERAAPDFPRCKGLQNYLSSARQKSNSQKSGKSKQTERSTRGKSKDGQKKTGRKFLRVKNNSTQSNEEPSSEDIPDIDPKDDTAHFIRSAEQLRKLTVRTGHWLERILDQDQDESGEGYLQVLQLAEKIQKLQAELRQTETKLLEIRKERAELWPRADVLASVGEVWVVCRGALDKLVGRMVDLENLPAWIQEVGGSMPETREARQQLQERIRDLIIQDSNELQDKLKNAAVPNEDFSEDVRYECREQLAKELEQIIERLRSDAD